MGRFDYDAAKGVFDQLVERHPESFEFRLNQTIAQKNRQGDGDELAALAGFQALLDEAREDLRARYCTGLLQYRAGSMDAALTNLRFVHEADPNDPHAAYFYGQALQKAENEDQARAAYGRALAADPYLRSAYYALALIERRSGDLAAAQAALADYQRLGDNPRAQLAEFKYTRMGRHCEAVLVGQPEPVAKPEGAVFEAPVALDLQLHLAQDSRPVINVVDLDGDGLLDLYINGAGAEPSAPGAVLLGQIDGSFANVDHPLAQVDAVNAAAFGDFDNDGLVDAYLARRGPNQLWRQTLAGQWQEIAASSGADAGGSDTIDALWLDADHDGDLDLWLLNRDAPLELLNNNLDGSFRPLAADYGLADPASAGEGRLLPLDLDNDRDLDLIVQRSGAPQIGFRNDRGWQYTPVTGLDGLLQLPLLSAIAAERDGDGRVAIYGLGLNGQLQRWQAQADGVWHGSSFGELGVEPPLRLEWLDFNGDGQQELLHATATHLRVFAGGDERIGALLYEHRNEFAPWVALARYSLDDGRGPRLLALDAQGALAQFAPGAGRYPFLRLRLSGAQDAGEGMRSNRSGIGTRLNLRFASHWTGLAMLRGDNTPGHGLQPLTIGLAGAPKLDFLRLLWTDGVSQSELDLAVGQTHQISETQRQLSSCPVLFAWDGERHRFVSDVLGVAGIGFLIEPDRYAEPRPWENFLLPAGLPVARDGQFEFKLGEPMEEIAYIDRIGMVAYDLPPGWQMTLDERMGTAAPLPTGEPIYWREQTELARASMNGLDVSAALAQADLQAVPPGAVDSRFLGRLAEPFELVLEFKRPLDAGPGAPVLVADGWVEYPYSQTVFAAWQAKASYQPPSLWARASDGQWQLLAEHFGYPAGMPRQMALPLPALPPGTTALKLSGNLEIYWDRVFIAHAEALVVPAQELPLSTAIVAESGFALRSNGPQKQPHYDYEQRTPLWDTRHLDGWYTELGEATELVSSSDGALAIYGPGEELQLYFRDTAPAIAAGWQRRYVLQFEGWAKDMDLYTGSGGTVEPLPGTDRRDAQAEALHRRYNTRWRGGY